MDGKPKSTNFLLEFKDKIPIYNSEYTIVRSDEACQRPKVNRDFYYRIFKYACEMRLNPTLAEKLFKDNLDKVGLNYRFQEIICPYIVDFIIPTKRIIIEIDGEHHQKELKQFFYDSKRDEFLSSFYLKILRFDNKTIFEKIKDIIKAIYSCKSKSCFSQAVNKRIHLHNYSYPLIDTNIFFLNFKNKLEKNLNRILTQQNYYNSIKYQLKQYRKKFNWIPREKNIEADELSKPIRKCQK